jgi:hypothetical protein
MYKESVTIKSNPQEEQIREEYQQKLIYISINNLSYQRLEEEFKNALMALRVNT